MDFEKTLKDTVIKAIKDLYSVEADPAKVTVQKTRKDFVGDFTIVAFSLLAYSKKVPVDTAKELGEYLQENLSIVSDYNVVNGFLNISIDKEQWHKFLKQIFDNANFAFKAKNDKSPKVVVEYSSPNTNKPLHLGHIRNNLLGWSISEILKASGKEVNKVNLVNDRGIHICKSMLAWKELAEGKTPEDENMKGDHFVGKYYVLFNDEYKKQVQELIAEGKTKEEAEKEAPWLVKAQKMLRSWERNSRKIRQLWTQMNEWVYAGFDETYKKLGIDFDKTYYESETYLDGKRRVLKGLTEGDLSQRDDGTVLIDLEEYGMDEKVLLRADGTSVYITQDIGTAIMRYDDFKFDESIYVVGNEQDYHFKVLSIILDKLEYPWSNRLTHLSYGMVELPEGKMKSREGTVVDADDLIEEMINTARKTSEELGKLSDFTKEEAEKVYEIIALGALKFYILKVDARKNITFNPQESIDFNGNTGPFVQYTYARIRSLVRKAGTEQNIDISGNYEDITVDDKEKELIKIMYSYPSVIEEAAKLRTPSIIANYVFDLAKNFNKYYHEIPILKEEDKNIKLFRLKLSNQVSLVVKSAMGLLGIDVPERM